jgi:VWFA-related protein
VVWLIASGRSGDSQLTSRMWRYSGSLVTWGGSKRGEALRTGRSILLGFLLFFLAFIRVTRADDQLETSQLPVQATVSSEPSMMQANAPPEGLIHLDVAATDREGKPFSGLGAKDFTLLDNGLPQKIVSFEAANEATDENERLTEVVLVLDEVNLSPAQLELVKGESIKFLRRNGGHLAEATSVYWFTTSGLYASAKPTTDGNAIAEDVAQHRSPRVLSTVPRNPFMTAESERVARWERSLRAVYSIAVERRGEPGRKLLVWMGFGWPVVHGREEHKDTAFSSLVELSTRIREARMVISEITARTEPAAFSFNDSYKDYLSGVRAPSEMEEPGMHPYIHFALPVLAIQSGGLVLDPLSDISRAIEDCVEDARLFYTVSFDPPHAAKPDEYHDLKVQIETPGLSARTNSGYYNQPVFYDQPRVPTKRVTVQELGEMLGAASEENDGELAEHLAGLELSERLSSNQLSLWKDRLRGKKSKAALVALADESAFLDPPAAEILSDPAPDLDTQRQMMSRTVNYLKEVIPKLPDFFAIRITTEYEQPSPQKGNTWKIALADQSLREAVTEKATLRYRNGHEEQDAAKKKGSASARKKDLNFIGVFGPILGSVLVDATRGDSKLIWSRWVQGEQHREAVFRYIVRAEGPHYNVMHCCLVGGKTFLTSPRYLGELAIDPGTGAILRLTMESEPGWIREPNLNPVLPVKGAAMMVEYGPVEIGGKRYVCPQRSVVIMRVRNVSTLTIWDQTFDIYAPYETLLDDIVYTDYHRFGSEARMLPEFDVVPDATPSPGVNGQVPMKPPPNR